MTMPSRQPPVHAGQQEATAASGELMAITLTAHEGVELDVHATRDRAALVVNGELLWMNRREIDVLRQKLVLALRTLDFPADLPAPRKA